MRARTTGMTLLEIMVAVAVFSVVMVAVMLMGWSTSSKYSNSESSSLLHTFAIQAMDLISAELAESGYVVETSGPYPAGEAPTFPYVIVRTTASPNTDASTDFGGYFNVYPYAKTSGGTARAAPSNGASLVSAINSATYFGSSSGNQEIVYIKPVYVTPGTTTKTYNPNNRAGYCDPTTLLTVWDIQQGPGQDLTTLNVTPGAPAGSPTYYPTEEYSFLLEPDPADGVNELVHRKRFGTFPDGTQRHVLARHCERVVFENYQTTGGLFTGGARYDTTMWVPANNQVKVTLWLAKLDTAGQVGTNLTTVKVCVQSIITLRNH